jgi:hypothetical protein
VTPSKGSARKTKLSSFPLPNRYLLTPQADEDDADQTQQASLTTLPLMNARETRRALAKKIDLVFSILHGDAYLCRVPVDESLGGLIDGLVRQGFAPEGSQFLGVERDGRALPFYESDAPIEAGRLRDFDRVHLGPAHYPSPGEVSPVAYARFMEAARAAWRSHVARVGLGLNPALRRDLVAKAARVAGI